MQNANNLTSWHIATAAEAIAAAQFARCGWDISVQYGANQPEYDLLVSKNERVIKISVKGSRDGGWGLTQNYKNEQTDYHEAADKWLKKHGNLTVYCLVQFRGVPLQQMPNIYLATPLEITNRLKGTAKGRGDTVLYERHEWSKKAYGAGTIDEIPEDWKFSEQRIEDCFNKILGSQLLPNIRQTRTNLEISIKEASQKLAALGGTHSGLKQIPRRRF